MRKDRNDNVAKWRPQKLIESNNKNYNNQEQQQQTVKQQQQQQYNKNVAHLFQLNTIKNAYFPRDVEKRQSTVTKRECAISAEKRLTIGRNIYKVLIAHIVYIDFDKIHSA